MARPIALDMRHGSLATTVKTRVVAGAHAGAGGIEVMEGGRKRWKLVRALPTALALQLFRASTVPTWRRLCR
jgi:hypothetical protein